VLTLLSLLFFVSKTFSIFTVLLLWHFGRFSPPQLVGSLLAKRLSSSSASACALFLTFEVFSLVLLYHRQPISAVDFHASPPRGGVSLCSLYRLSGLSIYALLLASAVFSFALSLSLLRPFSVVDALASPPSGGVSLCSLLCISGLFLCALFNAFAAWPLIFLPWPASGGGRGYK